MRLLVTRFIPLTPKDLEKWEIDVEEWMNQEENEDEQWEYELRVRVSSLFLLLAADFFCIAVCRACAINPIDTVQGLCSSYPTSIFRQCCGCVSLRLIPRVKLMNLQPNHPWSYPIFSPRRPFTALSADARIH